MKALAIFVALCAAVFLAACASTSTPTVDLDDSFRVLGRENDVRIDAQLFTREIGPSSPVGLVYEVKNFSSEPILFAPIDPSVEYHPDSRTITVGLGAEIPVAEALPAMVAIRPGESRSFTTGAAVTMPVARGLTGLEQPRFIQVRVNYLRGTERIDDLVEAETPQLSEGLFRSWVDHIAAVVTNALPIRWGASRRGAAPLVDASSQFPR